MSSPVPNRGTPDRALIHFYNGDMNWSDPLQNYSHSDMVRRTARGGLHEGDIRRNVSTFGYPHGYVEGKEASIPEDKINRVRPKKGNK